MATTDNSIIRATARTLDEIARSLDLTISLAMVFGSRARGDFTTDSDVDILLVSPEFEGMTFAKRSQHLYLQWPYDSLPSPEFLCFTPTEFEQRKERNVRTIINTILDEGIVIAGDDGELIP